MLDDNNIIDFQNLEVEEQIQVFSKLLNQKYKKRDFKEISNYDLYTLLTDISIRNNIKNEKLKQLLENISNIANLYFFTKLKKLDKVSEPEQVVEFLRSRLKNTEEECIAIFLDSQNKIIKYETISKGTISRSAIYPSKIAKISLLTNSRSVIVAHNHPSGTLKPSENDILSTTVIQKALKTIEVFLLDSIIITNDNYYSFKENNIL
ncbi:MAG: hypothetical protein IJ890_05475 [Clostridia bacterium]|nr:hypothetical protein [Clostridia bacterium]